MLLRLKIHLSKTIYNNNSELCLKGLIVALTCKSTEHFCIDHLYSYSKYFQVLYVHIYKMYVPYFPIKYFSLKIFMHTYFSFLRYQTLNMFVMIMTTWSSFWLWEILVLGRRVFSTNLLKDISNRSLFLLLGLTLKRKEWFVLIYKFGKGWKIYLL